MENINSHPIRNEMGNNTVDPTAIKRMIRGYHKPRYAHIFNILEKSEHFLSEGKQRKQSFTIAPKK